MKLRCHHDRAVSSGGRPRLVKLHSELTQASNLCLEQGLDLVRNHFRPNESYPSRLRARARRRARNGTRQGSMLPRNVVVQVVVATRSITVSVSDHT